MELRNKISYFFKNQPNLKICYKLLFDLLFILVLFFTLALAADGILPGIISEHVKFYAVIIAIAANITAINVLSRHFPENATWTASKKTAIFFLAVLALLFLNRLRGINIFLSLAIFVLSLASGYFIYKVSREK